MFWQSARVLWLFLLFTALPLIDMWLLLLLGDVLGFWPSLGLTIVSALLGSYLGKRELKRVWSNWRTAVSQLETPADGLTSGILILVGAALLIAPGVLTDAVGLLLLFPPSRRVIAKLVKGRVMRRIERARASGRLQVQVISSGPAWSSADMGRADDIQIREVAPKLPPRSAS